MDYKERLRKKASTFAREEQDPADEQPSNDCSALIRKLTRQDGAQRVVFQSVAVTAIQLLNRAQQSNIIAAEAAISLGQRERLEKMNGELRETMNALQEGLSSQGEQMLDLCDPGAGTPPSGDDGHSWWFALTESIEMLEEGATQMSSLAHGQPDGTGARHLGECLAELLEKQHAELLMEADQWIT